MKKLLIVATILLAALSNATQVLWVGIDENTIVSDGINDLTINSWISTLTCAPVDVGARIMVAGDPMPAGYEDPSGYIPPGQGQPSIIFDDPIYGIAYEFGVLVVDDNDEPTGAYADWQPIRLDNTDLNAIVTFELGYWDENLDWEFIPLAYANTTLGEIWNAHTYTAGDLGPPTQTPWKPDHFYYAVPEPDTAILALLGAILFLKRRKA